MIIVSHVHDNNNVFQIKKINIHKGTFKCVCSNERPFAILDKHK